MGNPSTLIRVIIWLSIKADFKRFFLFKFYVVLGFCKDLIMFWMGIFCFFLGLALGVGWHFFRLKQVRNQQNSQTLVLENQLVSAKEELAEYQTHLQDYFNKSTHLIANHRESMQKLEDHLHDSEALLVQNNTHLMQLFMASNDKNPDADLINSLNDDLLSDAFYKQSSKNNPTIKE
jgi:uncharacterized membrane-anchored protein YhcB (DUF1043 family)